MSIKGSHIKIRHAYDFSLCFPHELLMYFKARLQSLLRMCEFFCYCFGLWTTPEMSRMPASRVQRSWRNHWSGINSFEVESIEF